jgi:type III restriction enzyme
MRLSLKEYQKETIRKLGDYCAAVRAASASPRPERDAFNTLTGRDYFSPPGFDGVPYICLRLPTGGGKTLLAAHAVGTVARQLLGSDAPPCLWICPSTTIRDQTLRVLRDKPNDHHYIALRDALGPDVAVVTLEESLQQSNLVAGSAPLVIVTTIQSYRVKDDSSGAEIEANRRIYRDNGYLMRPFENLPPALRAGLAKDETGQVSLSLANALWLRSPIVIMDEAHNARTPTSFESLARFGPSCVVELTATPQHEHNPARDIFASNVLHPVSALALKKEGMIKLPVDLESRGDWLEVLAAAKQRRDELEKLADHYEETEGHRPIRPIVLVQAQPKRVNQDTHHAQIVKRALVDQLGISEREVRICTGTEDEIKDEDLMSRDSEVRYIITVDKLKEGWDCPFAYILASIGNAATPTAVEQLLGRVLRQPWANPTGVPALDRAYAFVLSDNVVQTAMKLRDRMVQNCGFDEHAATDALRVRALQTQQGLAFGRVRLLEPPAVETLPDSLRARITYDPPTQTLQVSGTINAREATALREVVRSEVDRRAIDDFWQQERPAGSTPRSLMEIAESMFVPHLALVMGDARTLFEPEELDEFSWNLESCETAMTRDAFGDDVRVGSAATIDLQGEAVVTASAGDVRLRQLELIGEGDDWTNVELARWLDRELHRDDTFLGLTKSESQPWMQRVVDGLLGSRKLSLPVVVRRRHELASLLRHRVAAHGRARAREAAQQLIRNRPSAIEASASLVFELNETDYAPCNLFDGHQFGKHAFQLVAAMNGEEKLCAIRIDSHANVKRWVRNTDNHAQGGFSLPKSPGRFFPDFIVELNNGIILIVEYKMGKMSRDPEELHKKAVGELWENRSRGKCRFAWVVDSDWVELERQLSAGGGN